MKSVWVTGAHGFLGRNLSRYLSEQGFYVIGIGHGHWEPGEEVEWGIRDWEFGDVTMASLYDLISKFAKPYAIFHTAGGSSVGASIENPYLDYKRTVGSTVDVLEFIRLESPETRFIYPSSAAVYGAVDEGMIHEDTPLRPVSPYGVHKKITEILCSSYAEHFNINVALVRFFSLYGKGLRKQLLWDLCTKLEKDQGPLVLHGTGEEIRDWLHVEDAVRLMVLAMENASPNGLPVNGGTGQGMTVKEITCQVHDIFGKKCRIDFNGVVREGDPRFYQAAIERAGSWGWSASRDWKEGIEEYVRWFKALRGIE
jgi:UDP-glucose 4-epimerase